MPERTVDTLTDAEACSRALVIQALAERPATTPRVARVARRFHDRYEQYRADGYFHREAFRLAWHDCHPLAETVAGR